MKITVLDEEHGTAGKHVGWRMRYKYSACTYQVSKAVSRALQSQSGRAHPPVNLEHAIEYTMLEIMLREHGPISGT